MIDPITDEWDGICACGKAAMDGVRCRLGATHVAPVCSEVVEEDYLA